MVHSKRLHGQIWLAVLKSQKISVISEAPEINLLENINRLKEAGLDLPDALLVDVGLRNFNPFAFCRWCRENCPTVKVILVNPSRQEITPSEQQWAMLQGAADLLPSFDIDNLVSSVADRVKRVLKSLDGQPLDNGALISVLLAMKRELDIRRGLTANGSQPAHAELPTLNGKSLALPSAPSPPSAYDAPEVPKPTIAEPTVEKPKEGRSLVRRLMDGVQLPGLSEKAIGSSNSPAPANRQTDKPPTPPASNPDPDDLPPDDDPPPVRKYRGKSY